MSRHGLLTKIEQAWRDHTASKFDRRGRHVATPRKYSWASTVRTCTRRMALDLKFPGDAFGEISMESMFRMNRGKMLEEHIYLPALQHVGAWCDPPFQVIGGQEHFEIFDLGVKLYSGKIDGRIQCDGETPVFEIKAGEAVSRVHCFEDFSRSIWTRHMPDQLLLYLYRFGELWGFFLIDSPAGPRFIEVVLEDHLDRVQECLDKARAAVAVVRDGAPLPDCTQDRHLCSVCPHNGRNCTPPLDMPGLKVIYDEGLEGALLARESNAAAAKMFKTAHETVRQKLKGVNQVLVGDFYITGKESGNNGWRTKISKLPTHGEAS